MLPLRPVSVSWWRTGEHRSPDEILRFRRSERLLHWAIAVPFLACFASAAILVLVYNPDPSRPMRGLFAWTHRISGICLALLPLLVALTHWRDVAIHRENIRAGWLWRKDDLKWLLLSGPAALSRRVKLPEQGKFNAGEKLNFMMVMGACPVFIVTGVLIWLPGIAFFSWILHVSIAAMAMPLMLGHIFMASINPATRAGLRGMISGYVDRRWAMHHYGRWYRENFDEDLPPVPEREEPVPQPGRAAAIRCPRCDHEDATVPLSRMIESILQTAPLICARCRVPFDAFSLVAGAEDLGSILEKLDRLASRSAPPRPGSLEPSSVLPESSSGQPRRDWSGLDPHSSPRSPERSSIPVSP